MAKNRKKKRSKGGGLAAPRPVPEPKVRRLDENRIEIEQTGKMLTHGLVYLSETLEAQEGSREALKQVMGVAHLPGIVGPALAMPDIHWGYGFPIGGVAAFDAEEGVVSPGGVGYDINCGCRLMGTGLEAHQVRGELPGLLDALFNRVPCGVGRSGPVRLRGAELKKVLVKGAAWAVSEGFGEAPDLDHIEDRGALPGADPAALSDRALKRGKPQLGTLGSGNHFLEIGVVDEVFEPEAANAFGLFEGQLTVMLHSGSRGLGYQVCDDSLKKLVRWAAKQGISLPDRQLVYAPLGTPQAEEYLAGMAAAANFAYANRQVLGHLAREVLEVELGLSPRELGWRLVVDVCHNVAKLETHTFEGQERQLCVHRKGATRAFGPGRRELSEDYRPIGQPVLIPGDMGRASYVLKGLKGAMTETFGSACHGAGRLLSRAAAKKAARGRLIDREMESAGVHIRAQGRATLAEEMPEAYKDVSEVVEVVHRAGIASKVARLRPLGVVKG